MPLGDNQRNYAEVIINLDPVNVIAQLKPISTAMYRIKEWLSDDEDDEHDHEEN